MSQYKFKCDDSKCKKTFFSSNPTNCPLCSSEEFTLIGKKNNYNFLLITLILSFLSLLVYYGFLHEKVLKPVNNDFKSFLNSYYEMLQDKDINRFEEFYSNNLKTWFNQENISLEEIIIKSSKYYNKYPYQVHDLNLDSLNITKVNDNYFLTYDLFYAYRKDTISDWKKIDIVKIMILNKKMKIISIEESIKKDISINDYVKKYSGNFTKIYYKIDPILTKYQIYEAKFIKEMSLDISSFNVYLPLSSYKNYKILAKDLDDSILYSRITEVFNESEHVRYGNLIEALAYIDIKLSRNSNFLNYRIRSEIYYYLGEYSLALDDINTSIKLNDDLSDKWFNIIIPLENKAEINYMLGNYIKAINDIESVLSYYIEEGNEFDNGPLIRSLFLKAKYLNANNDFAESCNVLNSISELLDGLSTNELEDLDYYNPNNTFKIKVDDYKEKYCF